MEYYPSYDGPLALDFYGRIHPKHSGGRVRTMKPTNTLKDVVDLFMASFDKRTDHRILFRRLGVCACDVVTDDDPYQLDLFTDYDAADRERRLSRAMLDIRMRYGSNAVLKGYNFLEGATARERNTQIGGHRA